MTKRVASEAGKLLKTGKTKIIRSVAGAALKLESKKSAKSKPKRR